MEDMKNNTKSKIIITMKKLDHANNLFKLLKHIQELAQKGGDLNIQIGDNKVCVRVGHDVDFKNIQHVIFND